jgi:hypothetical protein
MGYLRRVKAELFDRRQVYLTLGMSAVVSLTPPFWETGLSVCEMAVHTPLAIATAHGVKALISALRPGPRSPPDTPSAPVVR